MRGLSVLTFLAAASLSAPVLAGHHGGGHHHGHHGHGGRGSHGGTPSGGYGTGNVDEGAFRVELYRGAAAPFEITVMPTPACDGHMDLEVSWSAADNEVTVDLSGEGVLEPYPDVERTLGVNYTPNPFFPEPEDYQDGRYQLWLVSAAGPPVLFYYSPITLDLMGSQYDFEVPPPAIPVFFPTLYMFATPMFQPDANGDVDLSWTFPYDGAVRGDQPQYAHHVITFPPPNLCGADPNRLDLSTLRPYISKPFPAEQARPFSDYLRGGLLFDVTIEPGEYYVDPPLTSLAATYSGGTAVPGGIPNGWTFDIDAGFMGVAPPIRPWPGAGACEPTYSGVHTSGLNVCGGAP
ncbi:MAG: hypothetical protein KC501_38535 [Myxococcales bacterium]|nr:hypothetical protein [Myxococcales bacterium]